VPARAHAAAATAPSRAPAATAAAARAARNLRCERYVDPQLASGRAGEQLDGAIVVGRAEAAGAHEQVVREAVAECVLQLRGTVTDDAQLRGLDPEREQRPREERPVQVGAVAPDELGAGDDDRGARTLEVGQPRCHPCGVTVITCGL
jgi:hypothetical protein